VIQLITGKYVELKNYLSILIRLTVHTSIIHLTASNMFCSLLQVLSSKILGLTLSLLSLRTGKWHK